MRDERKSIAKKLRVWRLCAASALLCFAGCSTEQKADAGSALQEEAFQAVRQSVGEPGSASFRDLSQQVMPTVGAVCGHVSVKNPDTHRREARKFFYVRGQPVLVASDAPSDSQVTEKCRRATTEIEELKLLPKRK